MSKTLEVIECWVLKNGDSYYSGECCHGAYTIEIAQAKQYTNHDEAKALCGPNDTPIKIRITYKVIG